MKRYRIPCRAVLLWLASGTFSVTHAQVATNITPTVGAGDLGTTITQTGNSFDITGGTRPNDGPSLFHSFGQFSVGTGDIANLTNETALATENILSRVTAGSPSEIFGTLQTTGFPGADLYLLNPAGVLFGPTASLNVEGGFHVSTADFIRLSDGVRFDALPSPNDALLTTAPPVAFGFLLDKPPASITFRGDLNAGGTELRVPEGETFSVVGGNIQMQYTLLGAAAGEVNLVSVTSVGEVRLGQEGLDTDSFTRLGEIKLQTAGLMASGNGGGRIFIRGGQLVMQDATIWSDTWADISGRSIDIALTDRLTIEGGEIYTTAYGTGAGGNIAIKAPRLHLASDLTRVARIRAETQGPGRGGDLAVETEDILLEGHIPMEDEFTDSSGLVTVTRAVVVEGISRSKRSGYKLGMALRSVHKLTALGKAGI